MPGGGKEARKQKLASGVCWPVCVPRSIDWNTRWNGIRVNRFSRVRLAMTPRRRRLDVLAKIADAAADLRKKNELS